MKSEATMKAARSVLEKLDSNDTTCIDKAVQELNDIYTLKGIWNRTTKKNPNKRKQKKWYDYSCFEMSKRLKLVGKMVEKDPKNPYHRGLMVSIRKDYKKLIKLKKENWKSTMIKRLEDIEEENAGKLSKN